MHARQCSVFFIAHARALHNMNVALVSMDVIHRVCELYCHQLATCVVVGIGSMSMNVWSSSSFIRFGFRYVVGLDYGRPLNTMNAAIA